jgi:hypothetical protein
MYMFIYGLRTSSYANSMQGGADGDICRPQHTPKSLVGRAPSPPEADKKPDVRHSQLMKQPRDIRHAQVERNLVFSNEGFAYCRYE